MTTTLAPAPLEVADLEALLGELAPCDWTKGHSLTGVPCADVATSLAWADCTPRHRIRTCEHATAWLQSIRASDLPCGVCNRPAADCWRVVPI